MVITIPNPLQNLQPMSFDITEAIKAEMRVTEIATATVSTAPELMSVLVKACFLLANTYAALKKELRFCDKKVRERRAEVLLDIVPVKLADKKAGNNAEMREAVVETDAEYSRLAYAAIEIEAAEVLVREKLRIMEDYLNAVKQVLRDTLAINWRANPNLIVPPDEVIPERVPFVQEDPLPKYETIITHTPAAPEQWMSPNARALGDKAMVDYSPSTTIAPRPSTTFVTSTGLKIGKGKY